MGVSGSGKTTLAKALRKQTGWTMLEGDDFHSEENRRHMASGQPLTDAMREPWIERICERLAELCEEGRHCILACSGLRLSHRQRLRDCGFQTRFLHLQADENAIRQRLSLRDDHFMPASLLESQFPAFEPPEHEPDVETLDASRPFEQVFNQACRRLSGLAIPLN